MSTPSSSFDVRSIVLGAFLGLIATKLFLGDSSSDSIVVSPVSSGLGIQPLKPLPEVAVDRKRILPSLPIQNNRSAFATRRNPTLNRPPIVTPPPAPLPKPVAPSPAPAPAPAPAPQTAPTAPKAFYGDDYPVVQDNKPVIQPGRL